MCTQWDKAIVCGHVILKCYPTAFLGQWLILWYEIVNLKVIVYLLHLPKYTDGTQNATLPIHAHGEIGKCAEGINTLVFLSCRLL